MGISPESSPRKISRRDFLLREVPQAAIRAETLRRSIPWIAAEVALATLGGCQMTVEQEEFFKRKEREGLPAEGDIILIGKEAFLLRNGKRYPIPNLAKYKKYTKFDQYGRREFTSRAENYREVPLGEIPRTLGVLLDPFTGDFKNNKPLGGELNVYFGGFMTDGGVPYETIFIREDTFVDLRNGLKPKGWDPAYDSLFFVYGEKGKNNYPSKNTARPPQENSQYALDFLAALKEFFPLLQFNFIGHSLGGLFALAAAVRHYDAINNLILINSPVRGIEGNPQRHLATKVIRETLLRFRVGDEQVTDYLFDLWDNKPYQRGLENFVSFFTGIGKRLTVVIDENDPIVPKEAASLKGTDEIRIAKVGEPISFLDWFLDFLGVLKAHGRPLRDKKVIEALSQRLGEDLADAA